MPDTQKENFFRGKDLHEQAQIVENLKALCGDDEELLLDMVEGETDLFETLDRLARNATHCKELAEGTKRAMDTLTARKKRYETRAQIARDLMRVAMEQLGRDTLELPSASLTVKDVTGKYNIEEEADIPMQFYKAQPDKLDRSKLNEFYRARSARLKEITKEKDENVRKAMEESFKEEFQPIPGTSPLDDTKTLQVRVL